MDYFGWRHTITILYLLQLLGLLTGTSGLQCYSCVRSPSSEACTTTETCAEDSACYKEVERMEAIGKKYTKGCMDKTDCNALEDLNRRRYCPYFTSECYYCCSGNMCNGAQRHAQPGPWAPLWIGLVMVAALRC